MGHFSVSVSFNICDMCAGPMPKGDMGFPLCSDYFGENTEVKQPNGFICTECRNAIMTLIVSRRGQNTEAAEKRRLELIDALRDPDYMDNPDLSDDWTI